MENQILSFSRFGAYLMKYFSEYRALRLQFVVLTAVFTAMMWLMKGAFGFFTIATVMFIFSVITASRMSALFCTRVHKIKFLLAPASHLEKVLAMAVHLYVYIPLMFAVSIFVAQYAAMLLTALFSLSWPHFEWPYAGIDFNASLVGIYVIQYVGACAFYMMGATLFTRHTFLKTTALALGLGFLFTILMSVGIGLHFVSLLSIDQLGAAEALGSKGSLFIILFSLLISLLYWGVTYFRITEMEVNEIRK